MKETLPYSYYPSKTKEDPLVVLVAFQNGEGAQIADILAKQGLSCGVFEVVPPSWNDDLTPWPNGPIYHGDPGYQGKADAFVDSLLASINSAKETLSLKPKSTALCGYSLAGLFALYAGTKTEAFDSLISVSGSLWYPGFEEYAASHPLTKHIRFIDLSLGDKESLTKNSWMKEVYDKTNRLYHLYQSQGIETSFTLNPGGHFVDATKRTVNAITRYLRKC